MTLPALQDEIFRAYDIRGIVGAGLNADVMYWLGRVIGSEALSIGESCLLLGADARLSSPEFTASMQEGILAAGCDVISLGQIPTPLLYFATHTLDVHSGVMITGSHNAKDYNGVKIVFKQQSLSDSQITIFKDRINANDFLSGKGKVTRLNIKAVYLDRVVKDLKLQRNWKVVVDCGNAITAVVAPELFTRLGCQVIPLFCDIDGSFPNHHPDPTLEINLKQLKNRVLSSGADLGIAFDGDGDRVVLISSSGKTIDADLLLMAFVRDILPDHAGATVVFDVKSSQHLHSMVEKFRGQPLMCKSGHSFVKKAMLESDAVLGGEYSAHLFFKHRWYGFDDGLYAASRFLELMDKNKSSADDIICTLPSSVNTPELFIAVEEQEKFSLMEKLIHEFNLKDAAINTLDGLRVSLQKSWGLIRASNTTPNLVLRFEADSEDDLQHIIDQFRTELFRILPQLNIVF